MTFIRRYVGQGLRLGTVSVYVHSIRKGGIDLLLYGARWSLALGESLPVEGVTLSLIKIKGERVALFRLDGDSSQIKRLKPDGSLE